MATHCNECSVQLCYTDVLHRCVTLMNRTCAQCGAQCAHVSALAGLHVRHGQMSRDSKHLTMAQRYSPNSTHPNRFVCSMRYRVVHATSAIGAPPFGKEQRRSLRTHITNQFS